MNLTSQLIGSCISTVVLRESAPYALFESLCRAVEPVQVVEIEFDVRTTIFQHSREASDISRLSDIIFQESASYIPSPNLSLRLRVVPLQRNVDQSTLWHLEVTYYL